MAHNDRTLTYHLNRVAGLLVNDCATTTDVWAANVWAGSTGKALDLVGALNWKAGIWDQSRYFDLAGILNRLANTTDLGVDEAASYLT